MKLTTTTTVIVFLCAAARFSTYAAAAAAAADADAVQSVLLDRISVDPDPFDDLQFTLWNVATTSRPLKIVFNTREMAAKVDQAGLPPKWRSYADRSTRDSIRVEYAQKVFLTALPLNEHCVSVNYTTTMMTDGGGGVLAATVDTTNLRLYGGAEHQELKWPYDKMSYERTPYVTRQNHFQAVLEPYWLTSTGFFVYVDQRVPLFMEMDARARHLRLLADGYSATYIRPVRSRSGTSLNFTVCNFENARTAHRYAVQHYLGRPVDIPDTRRVREPIWSTWVRYGSDIDANLVLNYAREIYDHGYGGQIEIDDDWEECYGSLSPNANRFDDFGALVGQLKTYGFRVAVWTHPFVNTDCMPADVEDDFFVKSMVGDRVTHWWRGEANYIDFTNPRAFNWYRDRLLALVNEYRLDGLKFDGGESSFLPAVANFCRPDAFHPETIVQSYVRLIASVQKPSNAHARVARGTQTYPIFVTMMDRDTRWTGPLALSTLIPQLLQLNMLGYSFVLPDMVGGNLLSGQQNTHDLSELFVRWLQANVFMPSIQFSMAPWDFDEQVTHLSKKFVDLHARYADEIVRQMRRNVEHGDPVNPPIWWIAPDDEVALECDSEYLLGENLLVAPVLTQGATERDIYLPKGVWRDENRPLEAPFTGPLWIRNYPANLSVLPYFTRCNGDEGEAKAYSVTAAVRSLNTSALWFVVPALVILYFIVTRGLRMRKYFFGMFRPSGT